MANEIQYSFSHGQTTYVLVRNNIGQIWNTPTTAFQNYNTSNYSGYVIAGAEQGTASAFYTASMPSACPPGSFNVVAKQQVSTNPAETDPTIDAGVVDWNGSAVAQLSDITVSGVVQPIQLQRGVMIKNYLIYLKSSSDHITPFTSGLVSGQISKDGGAFVALQSGAFTEVGYGVYSLQALTSGDTSANTWALLFTANGVVGSSSDPLLQTFIAQHSSGY